MPSEQTGTLQRMHICSRCGIEQRVPEDFRMEKYTLASGEVTHYPKSCKECSARRVAAWRVAFIAKHCEQAWRDRRRGYGNSSKTRDYNREYYRLRYGKGSHVWAKYAHEVGIGRMVLVSTGPFLAWWDAQAEATRVRVRGQDALARAVLRAQAQRNMEIGVVDQIGVQLGLPGLLRELYAEAPL